MKKIMLLGDSIRVGYDTYVKEAFAGQAEVYYPHENCRFAQYTLRHFNDWLDLSGFGSQTDCIHWNAGLWDCLILYGDGCLTPIEVYGQFIRRICKRMRLLCPNAEIIFAASTPILEGGYDSPDTFLRHNRDIEAYNAVAFEAVREYGFRINDLYSLLKDVPASYHSDMTHYYTRPAAELITTEITKVIGHSLGLTPATPKYDPYIVPDPRKDIGY